MAELIPKEKFIKYIRSVGRETVTVIKNEKLNPEQITVVVGNKAFEEITEVKK